MREVLLQQSRENNNKNYDLKLAVHALLDEAGLALAVAPARSAGLHVQYMLPEFMLEGVFGGAGGACAWAADQGNL